MGRWRSEPTERHGEVNARKRHSAQFTGRVPVSPSDPFVSYRWGWTCVTNLLEVFGSMVMVGRIGWLLPCTVFFWSLVIRTDPCGISQTALSIVSLGSEFPWRGLSRSVAFLVS